MDEDIEQYRIHNKEELLKYIKNMQGFLAWYPAVNGLVFSEGGLKALAGHKDKGYFDEPIDYSTLTSTIANLGDLAKRVFQAFFLLYVTTHVIGVIERYYENTDALKKIKTNDAFTILHLIRNGLAHDSIWSHKYSKDKLPITYHGITYNMDLNDKPMHSDYCNFTIIWKLVNDVKSFIITEISDLKIS